MAVSPYRCDSTTTELAQNTAPRAFDVSMPQALLDIEQKSRVNYFPWRGQFSPQFVEAFLSEYASPEMTVYDPFMGSGTVLVEAARKGMPVIGNDLNPAAYWLARVYSFCNIEHQNRITILSSLDRKLRNFIAFNSGEIKLFEEDCPPLVSISTLKESINLETREEETLFMALSILLGKPLHSCQELLRSWQRLQSTVLQLPFSPKPVIPLLGDARQTNIANQSVDFILTSPPYINVINYHHHFRGMIDSMGWNALEIARSEIGANRKFRQNRFLIVVQYCLDMALTLREMRRVCKNDARLGIVIGRVSQVHRTPFCNSQILEMIAHETAGLKTVQVQQRAYQNRFGERITEDILHFQIDFRAYLPETSEAITKARSVAQDILLQAQDRVPVNRRRFWQDALDKLPTVSPSPLFSGRMP